MITYETFIYKFKKISYYNIVVKPKYCVITFPNAAYHITIYQDQWDDYQSVTGLPYHLFHVSSVEKEDRCSSYFWIDKTFKIKNIPKKYFCYEQDAYNFFGSTRRQCVYAEIKSILKQFQHVLTKVRLIL